MKNSVPIVWMKGISKIYRSEGVETVALRNINLTINKGEFIAITGRSGSGKSTLMHLIGLLDTPTSGTCKLNGVDVSRLDEDNLASQRNVGIGFVFQSFNLLPRATSLENVTLPAIYAGVSEEERLERATKLLTEIGLEDQLNKRPNQMSGGQQQRVAIARALMNDPELILADEPTGNLDTKSGEDVMNTLKKLNKDDKTIVLITHEKDIANQAKRMLHLEDGEIK